MNPNREKYIAEKGTAEELELVKLAEKLAAPRSEYKNGREKLGFRYQLSGGEVFAVAEDGNGLADVRIEKDGKVIANLKDYLPPGFKFVTPTYLNGGDPREKSISGVWYTLPDRKLMSVGDMTDAALIPLLFHEICHAKQGAEMDKEAVEKSSGGHLFGTFDEYVEFIIEDSRFERDAWAGAIGLMRKLKNEKGVDMFKLFPDFEEFKRIIYAGLLHNRFREEYYLQDLFKSRGLTAYLEESSAFLKQLFDKGKFGRRRDGSAEDTNPKGKTRKLEGSLEERAKKE